MRLLFPKPVWLLLCAYSLASLVHFAHNAEFIALYPNLPTWLTRGQVYLAWLAVAAVGVAAIVAARVGWPVVAAALLAVYGALGLDGLAHYRLALCSEHTLAANLTIWSEALTGLALLLVIVVLATRRLRLRRRSFDG